MEDVLPKTLHHIFPKDGFEHLISCNCWCEPKVLTGLILAWRDYELFEEWDVLHQPLKEFKK